MVQIVSALFLLLVLWSDTLTVTGFSRTELHTVTSYITRRITGYTDRQHAYVVKFPHHQCRRLRSSRAVDRALRNERPNRRDIFSNQRIYEGQNLVIATYKDLNPGREHSEHRLLYPIGSSPVDNLLNRNPRAGCVLFYTLNSPCTRNCANRTSRYNIIDGLRVFRNIRNKAFVFKQIFRYDQNEQERDVWSAWEDINRQIPFYRCDRDRCQQCFVDNTRNNNCMNQYDAKMNQTSYE